MAKKAEIEQTEIEAPYELPDGWKWCLLGDIVEVLNGYAFKSENYVHQGIRVIRITNVQDGYIEDLKPCFYPEEYLNNLSQYTLYENDLLISLTGNVGRVALLPKNFLPAALNQRVGCLREKNNQISKKYIAYYLRQHKFLSDCIKSSKGTAQLNMSTEWLKRYPIPLPPTLAKQQRIVNRIEIMFAKLDQAQEKAQSVLDSFEPRKAAILHKAFTGELTAKWRKENGVADDSWEEKTVGDCCTSLKYGTAKKSESSGKVAVIRMGNLQHGEIEYDDLVFSNDEEDIKKYSLPKGDVLFNRTNSPEWVGKTSIYRGDIPAIYAGYLIKLDYIKTMLIGDYLNYMLNSPNAKEYCNSVKTDGVNQSNINAQKIGAYEIPVPSLPEQQKIVRILDTVLEKESRAKETARTVLDQIALLKKSILARAFRGEL